MLQIHHMRYFIMILLAIPALLLAFGPLVSIVLMMGNLQNWHLYAATYVATALLALIFTGLIYFVRDFGL